MPPDAIAFYQPFHAEPAEQWGIYIFVDRLLSYASGVKLHLPFYNDSSDAIFLHLVLFEMFHHEFFHHLVECTATTIEIIAHNLGAKVPSYWEYREAVFHKRFDWCKDQPLEEALANAYAYNSLSFISRVRKTYRSYLVSLYQAALTRHWLREPPGYCAAAKYISGGQILGCANLLAMILGRPPSPGDALERISQSVMPSGFAAYVGKPDIPTHLIGTPDAIQQYHELVPAPNETYCNMYWPLDTTAIDAALQKKKAEEEEKRRQLRRRS
jgi:hypothetical protein